MCAFGVFPARLLHRLRTSLTFLQYFLLHIPISIISTPHHKLPRKAELFRFARFSSLSFLFALLFVPVRGFVYLGEL
jgi:hypothetical protein